MPHESDSDHGRPQVPVANAYPLFVDSAGERRRWDLSVAIAGGLFPEEGGPHARFYAALAIYRSDAPTDDEPAV
jgi:hypothetical protein